jgi:hypothetical protein
MLLVFFFFFFSALNEIKRPGWLDDWTPCEWGKYKDAVLIPPVVPDSWSACIFDGIVHMANPFSPGSTNNLNKGLTMRRCKKRVSWLSQE